MEPGKPPVSAGKPEGPSYHGAPTPASKLPLSIAELPLTPVFRTRRATGAMSAPRRLRAADAPGTIRASVPGAPRRARGKEVAGAVRRLHVLPERAGRQHHAVVRRAPGRDRADG